MAIYYSLNREARKAYARNKRKENIELARENDRIAYASGKNAKIAARRKNHPDIVRARDRANYAKNKEKILKRIRKNSATPSGKIRTMIRNTTRRIGDRGGIKSRASLTYLGCSMDEARAHIESQWLPGMNWENHGKYGWHIDHKIPLAAFNLESEEGIKAAAHYTNLCPLWARDNLTKGSKLL